MAESARPALLALVLVGMTLGIGFSYGPISATFAEMFPAKIRYSGAGITYAIGSIIGGAFAPTIAVALYAQFGTNVAVAGYLAALSLIGLIAVSTIRDRTGNSLDSHAHDIAGQDMLERDLQEHPERFDTDQSER